MLQYACRGALSLFHSLLKIKQRTCDEWWGWKGEPTEKGRGIRQGIKVGPHQMRQRGWNERVVKWVNSSSGRADDRDFFGSACAFFPSKVWLSIASLHFCLGYCAIIFHYLLLWLQWLQWIVIMNWMYCNEYQLPLHEKKNWKFSRNTNAITCIEWERVRRIF